MSLQQTQRIDYLDAVRAFSLILGIVFHASLSFMPIFIGWAVMDISTSPVVSVFVLISHSFRMEVFFLIAGFFARMKYHQLGSRQFLQSRLLRIGIPFLIGWFALRPLIVAGWTLGADSMRGEVDYFAALLSAKDVIGQLPNGVFVGTHLWFLYYLLLSTLCVIGVRWLLTATPALNQVLCKLVNKQLDSLMAWLCHSPWLVVLLAIPTAPCVWFMTQWGVDTPDKSLLPDMSVFMLYTGFFVFGWGLQRQTHCLQGISQIHWRLVLMAVLSIISTMALSQYQTQYSHSHYPMIKAAFAFNYGLMMWSMVCLTLGVFNTLIKRTHKLIRYLADGAYWLYLIHLPLVIYLQVAVAELPLPWPVKWLGVCVFTLVIGLLLYVVIVRSTFIGKLLNGKAKPRW